MTHSDLYDGIDDDYCADLLDMQADRWEELRELTRLNALDELDAEDFPYNDPRPQEGMDWVDEGDDDDLPEDDPYDYYADDCDPYDWDEIYRWL